MIDSLAIGSEDTGSGYSITSSAILKIWELAKSSQMAGSGAQSKVRKIETRKAWFIKR
jgi:hypothetical protein